jgi:hypothetical protein
VTIEWEAVQAAPADTLVELTLRDSAGQIVEDEREVLLGGRSTQLEPGWWLSWVGAIAVPRSIQPGNYEVVVRLRDRVNRRLGFEAPIDWVTVPPESRD